tara:strand:- start:939 stop:1205 length:267 start_codon:yes stop_codon:yes gene_type:complete
MTELHYYYYYNLKRATGPHKDLYNAENIYDNCTHIWGNAQNLTGDVTWLNGDVTGLCGDATNVTLSINYVYIGDVTAMYEITPIVEVM